MLSHQMDTHVSSFIQEPGSFVHSLHVWRGVRGEQSLWPLLWRSAAASVMCRNVNHAAMPGLITHIRVNMLVCSWHIDANISTQVLFFILKTLTLSLCLNVQRCICSGSQTQACGTAPGEDSDLIRLQTSQLVYPWTRHTSHQSSQILSVLCSTAQPSTSAPRIH